jgi:VanZ family protein
MSKTKILFHVLNVILIILYIYPGSILGYLIYGDFGKQPQLTTDFFEISSNHVYTFFLLSVLGLFAYYKDKKIFIINYLILISIILEILHLIIPNRGFQFGDLFGNILGVLLSIMIMNIFNYWRKR